MRYWHHSYVNAHTFTSIQQRTLQELILKPFSRASRTKLSQVAPGGHKGS
jgi:hypothetical protein